MTWVPISATGIVVHPFIASTRPQISLLVGDQFQLLAECENWYRGKNILTEIDGIFPKSCIKIFHGRLGANSKCDFMLKQEDLLQTEARITLRYALHFMKTSVNLINVVKVGERIQTVVEKLKYLNSFNTSSNLTNIRQSVPISSDNAVYRPKSYSFCTRKENNDISNLRNSIKNYRSSICSNDDKSSMFYKMNTLYDRVLEAHQQLACSLDELRESMKIEPCVRSSYLHAFPTITTWGEEQFPVSHSSAGKQNHKHVEKPPEYVMFHINAEILNPRKTQYFKFSLYQPMRPPWLSQVHSCILGPENTTCNVVFGGLEKRDMKIVIYLVIYVYDILINDAFPEIDINDSELLMNAPREIIGCNIVQLPSCKTDLAFKRGPTILDFHTRTSSIEFLYGLHEFLISNDMNCAQTLKNILPDLKLKFTPTFGQRNDYLMKSSLNSNCFVYPMFLPSVITTSFIRSTITITIHSLTQHSSRKRS
ncbi:hypothetical protein TRFO_31858 [Tritrichomonas foetus]|uniref:SH3 domain-containing protein n=1 Tax=Tritrichomonas foetus TaxID=1144522 RepID=A0A1J4JQ81_9EUKA|nr:hypothetical protein TRFO_31858 [Tritrichomonas foetus]|eukprot:OHT01319.1 hypothetical protein TRFO_31858 [Tritrichomonas foetus]